MKVLGLLAGMSWESSIEYERIINQIVREKLGGVASADLIIRSFNFADIEHLQSQGDWQTATHKLTQAAINLQSSGADAIVICTNTMHLLADDIQSAIDIPLIHIADATAEAIKHHSQNNNTENKEINTVALLGTRYTMEKDFYVGRLRNNHNLNVIVPQEPDLTTIHDVIYQELVRGIVGPESKVKFIDIINTLINQGAQGVIAGCTEIELLIHQSDIAVPLFPTAFLHAQAAAHFALEN